jgi:ABC-type multidrug transport system ATPase subunit
MHAAVSAEPLFVLENVLLGTERRARLRNVSVAIPRGMTAVLGWSGAGKTSLLNVLAGFEQPDRGKISSAQPVAWVPANDGLWPGCTALQHLTECSASREDAARILASFDLNALADQKPSRMSRGEQSRLAVARALAMPPRTLVMDEPLAHVDPARVGKYWAVLREHIAAKGVSLVFATHAPEIALGEATHAICLRAGELIYHGGIRELYANPATEELAALMGPTNWLVPVEAARWLGQTWSVPRSLRPEHLRLEPASDGATAGASRFRGAYCETDLQTKDGERRVFLHRPPLAPAPGTRLRVTLLLVLLLAFCTGCSPHSSEPVISVKEWHSWVLPNDGPTQPTPRSIAVGAKGDLAILDTAGRVLLYHPDGTLIRHWKMLDVQFGKPEGIVWLKDGRLVVCDTHYFRIVWFDPEGKVLRMVGKRGTGHAEFDFPVGITKDAAENLYVCEYGGHDRVQVFSREGKWLRQIGSAGTGPGQFQRPSGMAWNAGKLYVADAVNHRVLVFKDTGEYLGLLGETANGGSALTFNLPYDISLAPDGAFYVIEYGAGRLTKVSADGRLLGRFGTTGSGTGQFATPWGLTFDSHLRAFIADTKNRRLVVLQL